MLLFGVLPVGWHRLTIEEVDEAARRVQSDESSVLLHGVDAARVDAQPAQARGASVPARTGMRRLPR